jgi:hypothetical protein
LFVSTNLGEGLDRVTGLLDGGLEHVSAGAALHDDGLAGQIDLHLSAGVDLLKVGGDGGAAMAAAKAF